MDRLSAHIDRSWDLVFKGKITAALIAAQQALALDTDSPVVHNLIGYLHFIEGDLEEALNSYQKAMDLDEWYLEPLLSTAELQSHQDANPNEAIRLCRRAIGMNLNTEEYTDATLIEVDALFNADRREEALDRLSSLNDIETLPLPYQITIARTYFESGDIENAQIIIDRVLEADEKLGDAWYCLGLIEQAIGHRINVVQAFNKTRECDLLLPQTPWHKSNEQLEFLLKTVMGKLDHKHAEMLSDTEIMIADYPSAEQIALEVDPRQIILAHGINNSSGTYRQLWIFSINCERLLIPSSPEDDLKKILTHELDGGQI